MRELELLRSSDQYAIVPSRCQYRNGTIMAPPKKDTEALTLRLSRDMLELIDEARRKEADIPTRPEMIRRVLEAWAKADRKSA